MNPVKDTLRTARDVVDGREGGAVSVERPFSPESLAVRWACSAEKIRRMYHDGELAGFRLGKLIRIPAAEVERIECQNTPSDFTGESTSSGTKTTSEDGFESRLARQTGASRRLALVSSGRHERPPPARG